MATSGDRNFTPRFADMMTEAFSNSGIRAANVTQDHIENCILSANLMLIYFGTKNINQYQLIEHEITLETDVASYVLPAGTNDVWHAVLRRDGSDTPVWPISRSDYANIPDKDNSGRAFNYTTTIEQVGNAGRSITLWPVPDRADTLRLWLWVQPEMLARVNETLGVGKLWYDAYAKELSARVALKYAGEKFDTLKMLATEAFALAATAGRERRDLRIRARGYTRPGRRF